MLTINKLAASELPELKLVYEEAFEGSTTDFARMTDIFYKISDNQNYIILCAKIDNKVVGSVMGIVCDELFGQCLPFMVVENVAVLKLYRRQGVARELLLKLEEHAKQQFCTTILFVSSEHRTGAHKLYESVGYGIDKVNGYRKRLS